MQPHATIRFPIRWALVLVGLALVTPYPSHAENTLLQEVVITPNRVVSAQTQPFILVLGTKKWTIGPAEVKGWFKTRTGSEKTLLQLRPGAIYDYLNIHVSPSVNDLGESSRFVIIDGNLHLVGPGRKGKIVDGAKTSLAIRNALVSGKLSASVSMKEYRPGVFSAQDFKKLNFPDHLARGETNFAGSPANRIHNIGVATKRYNGLVLMPGEEFSFNQYLGNVDDKNGYLPELVIKENVTTPEYGGGICQVSTTAFRAAMNAGFNITNRRNHSYPVEYYGAPGFDATVYAPFTDLTFTNDTAHPAYLITKILGTRLVFDVYGTRDGREVIVHGPFTTQKRPDGSLTAVIAQFVKKNGKTIREKNFVSHYQSPDKFPTVRALNGE